MKSFPSSFTKNALVQTGGLASGNIKQTLKNMAGAIMNNALGGKKDTVKKEDLGQLLQWPEFDYNEALNKVNYTNDLQLKDGTFGLRANNSNKPIYENANKIPAQILASMNKYRRAFKKSVLQVGKKSKNPTKGGKPVNEIIEESVSQSLFNPWFGVRSIGAQVNTPLMMSNIAGMDQIDVDAYWGNDQNGKPTEQNVKLRVDFSKNRDLDFTDCSIHKLVELSKYNDSDPQSLGVAKYKYADFMYCKYLGQISNNHLITLRKFSHPIGDNIFAKPNPSADSMPADVGRLVTWFGTEDNKLEEICKYSMNATWKEFNSELQDVESKEDNDKFLPSLINITNPQYLNAYNKNGQFGNNWFFKKIAAHSRIFAAESPEGNDPARYYKDPNKIWTPLNTIQSTHQYEGKLTFNHEFSLVFSYKLRSYDGINPKSAFLDLIGNILEVTYKRGTFWGGGHRWCGAPRNQEGWRKANEIFDKFESGAKNAMNDIIGALYGSNTLEDLGSLITSAFQGAYNLISGVANQAKDFVMGANGESNVKDVGNKVVSTLTGMLKNKLGRPAIYALNSVLSSEPVGIWHLTVGNPRNPILSIGNLIMTNAELQHSGPLGIDDFPTEIKVTVQLKHAMPRDLSQIASMYTCGQGGLLLPLNGRKFKALFGDDPDYSEFSLPTDGDYSRETKQVAESNNAGTTNNTGNNVTTPPTAAPKKSDDKTEKEYQPSKDGFDAQLLDSIWTNIGH